ncbi:MAG: hypothetical protein NMNS02_21930 [Nitrosomonas sp.]|nr:MAG: hypothetical protein NMNS02_21930 [Nitrosomonas sp.]
MSELDHVLELLENVKESANQAKSNVSFDEWSDRLDWSVVYGLIHILRKACGEYERYWNDDKNWKMEDDEEFMNTMNDSDELQWLVTDLDFGRDKSVKGKNTRFYDPAYHAAAESLQMAMCTYKYPSDKESVQYCINGLKQILTRYHAASLEIAMHRDNVYLHNNAKNIETVRKTRERSRDNANRQKEEADKRHKKFVEAFKRNVKNKKPHETRTSIVEKTAAEEGVGISTAWRAMRAHDFNDE